MARNLQLRGAHSHSIVGPICWRRKHHTIQNTVQVVFHRPFGRSNSVPRRRRQHSRGGLHSFGPTERPMSLDLAHRKSIPALTVVYSIHATIPPTPSGPVSTDDFSLADDAVPPRGMPNTPHTPRRFDANAIGLRESSSRVPKL